MFCWMDLKTHGLRGTADFFSSVLGWDFAVAEEDPRRATSVYADGRRIAGVSDLSAPPYPPNLPAHVAYYIAVDDADRSTAAAEAAGARVVVEPFDAGGQGRTATLVDPVGAAVSLWEGRSFRGWTRARSMLLACAEPERAEDFYTRALGGVPREASILRRDGAPAWELVLGPRDPGALAGRARERGGAVVSEEGVTRLRSAEGLSFVLGTPDFRGGDRMSGEVALRRAVAADAEAMAGVWLRSFAAALPSVRRAHGDDEVRTWFARVVVPGPESWVCTAGGRVVGLLVLGGETLEQLYLEPEWRGRGLGDRMVRLAKERRPRGLELWTFRVNAPARRFYERHGFTAVEETDGSRNEEREPDVRYVWRP